MSGLCFWQRGMRYRRIHRKALLLDQIVSVYKRVHGRKNFPHKLVKAIIVPLLFERWKFEGKGAFKTVHRVYSTAGRVALKTAAAKYIRRDLRVYKRLPAAIRNRFFAKIYWHTKYCLLQKYGKRKRVPVEMTERLREVARRYGLSDVRPGNVREVAGQFKIVDANLAKAKRTK